MGQLGSGFGRADAYTIAVTNANTQPIAYAIPVSDANAIAIGNTY